jgi:hypothetical protein
MKNWFVIGIFTLVFFAALLRFYNYDNRWGLGYDQAHDVLVARYALEDQKIPLLGPFSSAGPFQTGGEWYWFIMASTLVYPNTVITPWVVLTSIYVIFVLLVTLLGKEIINKQFGLLIGLFAAVSTSQIAQSVNLTNQSPLAIISLFSLWSMIMYVKSKRNLYLFFLGLSVSLAATIHLQGAALFLVIFFTIVFTGIPTKKGIGLILFGILIPLVPLIISDFQTGFLNSKNMLNYYLFNQNRITFEELGRRWLTYGGVFWPQWWTHILGGNIVIGYITIICFLGAVFYSLIKKTISREWLVMITSFAGIVMLLRYIRTPIFDSYLVFIHPFVFLFVGWTVYVLSKKNVMLAILLSILIVGGSLLKDTEEINVMGNSSNIEARERVERLAELFPNQKFSVYSYQYKLADKNLILSLYLDVEDKISEEGRGIGVVVATKSGEFRFPIIVGDKTGYQLLDLQSSSSGKLSQNGWARVNAKDVYLSTQEWYSKK